MSSIRIGTRKSHLAMWQTEHVKGALTKAFPNKKIEIVPIVTQGDRVTDKPLSALGVSAFTKEIEAALLDGRCDMAVHSLKDLATVNPPELVLAAYLPRADRRDVFISRERIPLAQLPKGAVVGTSSLRRVARLKSLRPDLDIVSLRGNVPTRLQAVGIELPEQRKSRVQVDATIMAAAGLQRLGLDTHITEYLDDKQFLPAPGQGVIALQVRASDESVRALAATLNCQATQQAVEAERTFLNVLEGGCRLPIGAAATWKNEQLELCGTVMSPDGTQVLHGMAMGVDPKEIGRRLALELLENGAVGILEALRLSPKPESPTPESPTPESPTPESPTPESQ